MFKRKKNKFNAVKTLAHGRLWSSKLELKVYEMLLMMERGGKFSEIKCQVHCRFKTEDHGKIIMIPDFSAVDNATGKVVYIEAKGFPTASWKRKKKAWAINGPGILYIYGGPYKSPLLIETIVPKTLE